MTTNVDAVEAALTGLSGDDGVLIGEIGPAIETDNPAAEPAGWSGCFPRSSVTLMAAVDARGFLTPLCTAGDLVRWCRAVWRAELR